jgi:hypothetical protein
VARRVVSLSTRFTFARKMASASALESPDAMAASRAALEA